MHKIKNCPFCGELPPLAKLPRAGRYLVGCTNDDCAVNPQAGGATLAEAWANWNRRRQPRISDLEAVGAGFGMR